MEDIVAKVLKRDISLCQNVIAALKAAAQSGTGPELPAWIIVMQEVVLITRLEFGLPEAKNFLDLDPEAAEFARALHNDFMGYLAKCYKQYQDPLHLSSVLVCNAAPYVEMMERRVADLEKIVLTENVDGGLSWAVFDLNGHPLKVMHVDSFTGYKDEYINIYELSGGGVGFSRKLRMQSTASPLAEIKKNLDASMRKLFLEEGRDGLAKDVVGSVNELKAHAPPAPKNLRYGPPVRGTRGRIRNW